MTEATKVKEGKLSENRIQKHPSKSSSIRLFNKSSSPSASSYASLLRFEARKFPYRAYYADRPNLCWYDKGVWGQGCAGAGLLVALMDHVTEITDDMLENKELQPVNRMKK
jgi:hypothetical protein